MEIAIKSHIGPWCADGIRDYWYINSCASGAYFRGGCLGSAYGLGCSFLFFGVDRERNTEKAERMHSIGRVPRNRQYRHCGGKKKVL